METILSSDTFPKLSSFRLPTLSRTASGSFTRLLSPKSSRLLKQRSQDECTISRPLPVEVLPKLKVVMDVDECMLFAFQISPQEVSVGPRRCPQKSTIVWTDGASCFPLRVFLRPGLKNFLHEVSQFADLYVMTAGNKSYAMPLIRLIDPELEIFKRIITRENFDFKSGKNLESLKGVYDERRTVLVDNMAPNFSYQRSNGILVREYCGDLADNHLSSVLDLLLYLKNVNDVRDILKPTVINGECFHSFADEFNLSE